MIKGLLFSTILFVSGIQIAIANNHNSDPSIAEPSSQDSLRLVELDLFWVELSRTVSDGDFEGYGAAYHEDAVVVFAAGNKRGSVSITDALAGWKQGFIDTYNGKKQDNVEFRFSQRLGNETTAHDTGMFHFTSSDSSGEILTNSFTHFEMLFVKRDNTWYAIMEYQKSSGTKEEWELLR